MILFKKIKMIKYPIRMDRAGYFLFESVLWYIQCDNLDINKTRNAGIKHIDREIRAISIFGLPASDE